MPGGAAAGAGAGAAAAGTSAGVIGGLSASTLMSVLQMGMMGYQMYKTNQRYAKADAVDSYNADIGTDENNDNSEVTSDGKIDTKANFLKLADNGNKPNKSIKGLGGFSSIG